MSTADDNHAEPRPLDLLATALAEFQAEMPTVPKSHTATVKSDKGSYSYTYAGLADVSEAAMPLLAKHGLSFTTLPGQGVLTGMLLHKSGQHLTASLPVTGGPPQAIGSSLTYGRRYLLGCMTGLVTDDDDDGQLAQSAPRKSKPAAEPPPHGETRPVQRARPSTPPASGPRPASRDQVTKLNIQIQEFGITDRAEKLDFISAQVKRKLASSNDLTSREASDLIEAFENGEIIAVGDEPPLDDPTLDDSWPVGRG